MQKEIVVPKIKKASDSLPEARFASCSFRRLHHHFYRPYLIELVRGRTRVVRLVRSVGELYHGESVPVDLGVVARHRSRVPRKVRIQSLRHVNHQFRRTDAPPASVWLRHNCIMP